MPQVQKTKKNKIKSDLNEPKQIINYGTYFKFDQSFFEQQNKPIRNHFYNKIIWGSSDLTLN